MEEVLTEMNQTVQNLQQEEVKDFPYLRSKIRRDGRCDKDFLDVYKKLYFSKEIYFHMPKYISSKRRSD